MSSFTGPSTRARWGRRLNGPADPHICVAVSPAFYHAATSLACMLVESALSRQCACVSPQQRYTAARCRNIAFVLRFSRQARAASLQAGVWRPLPGLMLSACAAASCSCSRPTVRP